MALKNPDAVADASRWLRAWPDLKTLEAALLRASEGEAHVRALLDEIERVAPSDADLLRGFAALAKPVGGGR